MVVCYHIMLNEKPCFESTHYESAKNKFDAMNDSIKLTKDTYAENFGIGGGYRKVKSEVLLEK